MSDKLSLNFTDSYKVKRIGQKNDRGNLRHRPILVTFDNLWDRRKLFAARIKLKSKGYTNVYINEDLTKNQATIFFLARKAKMEKLITNTWTSNGSVTIKTLFGTDTITVADLKAVTPGFDHTKYSK